MFFFPQLQTGAVSQFPLSRRSVFRVIENRLDDDRRIAALDDGAAATEWRLALVQLSDAEMNSVATLFQSVEGQLAPFTFLDPMENLLQWSEDFSNAVWVKDAS